ncbi:hypothetical protein [Streptomyces mirabilis]|uniref:hypothetical protein n=1 Tax=Streptomyces mirabilis TaxID=68239 RepID=UPI0036BD462E
MVDVTEIYVHWYAGRSKSALAASLGVDRKNMNGPSYRPNKRPKNPTEKPAKPSVK